MVGVTVAHSAIQMNLSAALANRLRGKPCRPHGAELKISVAGRIRYPDALVVCTPLSLDTKVVAEPVVVFEILSPSTAHTDLVLKNAEYHATPSIRTYVVLEQTHAGALVFRHKGDDWVSEALTGDDAVLHLPEIGIEIPLAELYADLAFPDEEGDQPP
jgi:Uma2 family endonuclease